MQYWAFRPHRPSACHRSRAKYSRVRVRTSRAARPVVGVDADTSRRRSGSGCWRDRRSRRRSGEPMWYSQRRLVRRLGRGNGDGRCLQELKRGGVEEVDFVRRRDRLSTPARPDRGSGRRRTGAGNRRQPSPWRRGPNSAAGRSPSSCRTLRATPARSRSTPRRWGSSRCATGFAWCSFLPATAPPTWCRSAARSARRRT